MDYPEDLKELYFEFGRTTEMAQVMEVEAGNLALAFVTIWIDPAQITEEQRKFLHSLIDDVNKRTFGNLVKQIRSIGQMDDSIVEIVEQALEKRNYLIHRFFRSHNFAIHSEEGRKTMRAEISEIYRILNLAHTVLSGMTSTLQKVFGREDISEQFAKELLEKGKKVEI